CEDSEDAEERSPHSMGVRSHKHRWKGGKRRGASNNNPLAPGNIIKSSSEEREREVSGGNGETDVELRGSLLRRDEFPERPYCRPAGLSAPPSVNIPTCLCSYIFAISQSERGTH
ncbi:unnamed protein product, partial [Allacma fusca]